MLIPQGGRKHPCISLKIYAVILRGVYPHRNAGILRSAQNDRRMGSA
jgi:hypothetical protein